MNYLDNALEILKILNDHNYDAFIVGGYVRDYMLGIESNDIDLTSNAKIEDVNKLFKTIPTGVKYGTVLIDYNGFKYEHTTFRFDGAYNDSRHPSGVLYATNVLDDLKRRDFTINAFLMDKDKNIIDYLDGKKDLDNKLIKTIGNPDNRFNEDALRMLRAIAFISKLGFDIEKDTYNSILNNKELLKNVSVERIRIEFDKISNGKYRSKAWEVFYNLKLNEIFPNMPIIKSYDKSFNDILIDSLLENGEISDFWQISKTNINTLRKCKELIINGITDYNLFMSGYLASKCVLDYLKKDISMYENLKIKSLNDLKINGNDLKFVTDNKRSECLNHLAKLVLENKIDNNYDCLLEEAKKWNI